MASARFSPRRLLTATLLGLAGLAIAQAAGPSVLESIRIPTGLAAESADLAIRGNLDGGGAEVLFDMATLMAFPVHSFTCADAWDGQTHKFTGALLADVLTRAGIARTATRITVGAKNNYTIPIRRCDYEKYGYLLAWDIDGHPFRDAKATRNRGNLIIAIDFDGNRGLDPQVYKHQLVWQVSGIVAE